MGQVVGFAFKTEGDPIVVCGFGGTLERDSPEAEQRTGEE
jgi:hypothetical protein